MLTPTGHSRQRIGTRIGDRAAHRGFSLVELVVVIIILGVLAAVAVPRFVNFGTAARVASVKTFAGVLQTTSDQANMFCRMNSGCANTNNEIMMQVGNNLVYMIYGYLDAGDFSGINGNEIDTLIAYSGFTVVLDVGYRHRFTLDGAPDPTNCWAGYAQAMAPGLLPTITTATSGC